MIFLIDLCCGRLCLQGSKADIDFINKVMEEHPEQLGTYELHSSLRKDIGNLADRLQPSIPNYILYACRRNGLMHGNQALINSNCTLR